MKTIIQLVQKKWQIKVLLIVLSSILLIHISGYIGTKFFAPYFGWKDNTPDSFVLKDSFEGRFARFDSGYYLTIAESGYSPNGYERAFFPLYPILCSLLSKLSGMSLAWSGVILSMTCYILSGLMIFKWANLNHDEKTALWTVIFFCFFPISFFLVAFYPESLFLLLSISSVYFAQKGKFFQSGLLICFAGITRPIAFLLAIPYIWEFFSQKKFCKKKWAEFILGGLVAPLGMISFLLYLNHLSESENFFSMYFSIQNVGWYRTTTWPWITIFDIFKAIIHNEGIGRDWFSKFVVVQDLFYFLIGFIMSVWMFRKTRNGTSVFTLSSIIFLSTQHGPFGFALWSFPRFLAQLFPIYLIMADVTKNLKIKFKILLIVLSAVYLVCLSIWFSSGRWVA